MSHPTMSRRRFLSLFGTSSMTGALLAACGAPAQTAQPTAATGAAAPAAAATTAPVAAATTAPVAAATAAPVADAVPLRYVYVGGVQPDQMMVQDALNKLLPSKGLNANVTLEQLDWGAYEEKVNLMNTGGEAFDLVFTAPWINNYYKNVINGTLAPLDDLLPAHAANLWASMPETTWDAARVGGKIYGVINQQIFPKQFGPFIRKDLAEKYKLDLASVTSYDQLTPFMQQVKDGEPDIKYIYLGENGSNLENFGIDPVDQALGFPGVRFDDPDAKVINFLETPEVAAYAARTKQWREAGFTTTDELKQEEIDALYKGGKVAMIMSAVTKPGGEQEVAGKYGFEWISQPIAANVLTTGGVVATLSGIPVSSKNPEAAMQLLDLMNTDPEVYNLLAKGIEGTHWQWLDQSKNLVELIDSDTSGYKPGLDWLFGNQFNSYYTDPIAVGNWQKTKALNDSAKPSPILGFTFDRTPVETELAQTSEVWARVWKPIFNGDSSGNIETANAELKAAGADTIIAELQKQIDAWKATKSA